MDPDARLLPDADQSLVSTPLTALALYRAEIAVSGEPQRLRRQTLLYREQSGTCASLYHHDEDDEGDLWFPRQGEPGIITHFVPHDAMCQPYSREAMTSLLTDGAPMPPTEPPDVSTADVHALACLGPEDLLWPIPQALHEATATRIAFGSVVWSTGEAIRPELHYVFPWKMAFPMRIGAVEGREERFLDCNATGTGDPIVHADMHAGWPTLAVSHLHLRVSLNPPGRMPMPISTHVDHPSLRHGKSNTQHGR